MKQGTLELLSDLTIENQEISQLIATAYFHYFYAEQEDILELLPILIQILRKKLSNEIIHKSEIQPLIRFVKTQESLPPRKMDLVSLFNLET